MSILGPLQASHFKVFTETLLHFSKYQRAILPLRCIASCPHIPRSGVDPWQEIHTDFFRSKKEVMLHLRTRDFSNPSDIDKFIEQATSRLGTNHSVLLVFGDLYKISGEYEIKPWEAIGIAKKYLGLSQITSLRSPAPIALIG